MSRTTEIKSRLAELSQVKGRDLTAAECAEVDRLADEHDRIMSGRKAHALVQELAAGEGPMQYPDGAPRGGSWGQKAAANMAAAASELGVKAVLSGQIRTEPTVEVGALPEVPTTILDLIGREPLDQNTYAYLRQSAKANNAAVVADGATKPTSVYSFVEVEDRARVIAHLSEPFPLRYLEDHVSMSQVLDSQMVAGVHRALEDEIMAGDGTGEHFTGILNTPGVRTQAYATDVLTTIRTARSVLEAAGEKVTAWALHPIDALTLELARTDSGAGEFLMAAGSMDLVFGQGVARVVSSQVPQGSALGGDWNQIKLMVRENAATLAATQANTGGVDLWATNQVVLRAEGRFALKNLRPSAFIVADLTAA